MSRLEDYCPRRAYCHPRFELFNKEIKKSLDKLRDVAVNFVKYNMFLELINFHLKIDSIPPGLQIDLKPLGFSRAENPLLWNEWTEELRNCSNSLMTMLKYHYSNEVTSLGCLKCSLKREIMNAIMIEKNCNREDAKSIVEDWIENSVKYGLSNLTDLFYAHSSKSPREKFSDELLENFYQHLMLVDSPINEILSTDPMLSQNEEYAIGSICPRKIQKKRLKFDNFENNLMIDETPAYDQIKIDFMGTENFSQPDVDFLPKEGRALLSYPGCSPQTCGRTCPRAHSMTQDLSRNYKFPLTDLSYQENISNDPGSCPYKAINKKFDDSRRSSEVLDLENFPEEKTESTEEINQLSSKPVNDAFKNEDIIEKLQEKQQASEENLQSEENKSESPNVSYISSLRKASKANAETNEEDKPINYDQEHEDIDQENDQSDYHNDKPFHDNIKKQRAYSQPSIESIDKLIRKRQVSFGGVSNENLRQACGKASTPLNQPKVSKVEELAQLKAENAKLRELLSHYLFAIANTDPSIDKAEIFRKILNVNPTEVAESNKETATINDEKNVNQNPLSETDVINYPSKSSLKHYNPSRNSSRRTIDVHSVNSLEDLLKLCLSPEEEIKPEVRNKFNRRRTVDIKPVTSEEDLLNLEEDLEGEEESASNKTSRSSKMSNDSKPAGYDGDFQTLTTDSEDQEKANLANMKRGPRRTIDIKPVSSTENLLQLIKQLKHHQSEAKKNKKNLAEKNLKLSDSSSSKYDAKNFPDGQRFSRRKTVDIKSVNSEENLLKDKSPISRRTFDLKSVSSKENLLDSSKDISKQVDLSPVSRRTIDIKSVTSNEDLLKSSSEESSKPNHIRRASRRTTDVKSAISREDLLDSNSDVNKPEYFQPISGRTTDVKSVTSNEDLLKSSSEESSKPNHIRRASRRTTDVKSAISREDLLDSNSDVNKPEYFQPISGRTTDVKSIVSKEDLLDSDLKEVSVPDDADQNSEEKYGKEKHASGNVVEAARLQVDQTKLNIKPIDNESNKKKRKHSSTQQNNSSDNSHRKQVAQLSSEDLLEKNKNNFKMETLKQDLRKQSQNKNRGSQDYNVSSKENPDRRESDEKGEAEQRNKFQRRSDEDAMLERANKGNRLEKSELTQSKTHSLENMVHVEYPTHTSSNSRDSPGKNSPLVPVIDSKKTSFGFDMPSEIASKVNFEAASSVTDSKNIDEFKDSLTARFLNESLQAAEKNMSLNANEKPFKYSPGESNDSNVLKIDVNLSDSNVSDDLESEFNQSNKSSLEEAFSDNLSVREPATTES